MPSSFKDGTDGRKKMIGELLAVAAAQIPVHPLHPKCMLAVRNHPDEFFILLSLAANYLLPPSFFTLLQKSYACR